MGQWGIAMLLWADWLASDRDVCVDSVGFDGIIVYNWTAVESWHLELEWGLQGSAIGLA